jgi:membrane fusion protein (multidrug efflux system)
MSDVPASETTHGKEAAPVAPNAQGQTDKSSLRRILTKFGFPILAMLVVLAITFYFFLPGLYEEKTDDAYVEAHVVSEMPKVPAYVLTLHFDDNTRVTAGELLAELDPRDYLANSNVARASLDVAESTLIEARSEVLVANANASDAKANVELAQANATLAAADLKRFRAVSDSRAVSSERLDTAQATADGAHATLDAAKAKALATASLVEVAKSKVKTAEDAVDRSRALLARVELDLSYTRIFAPVSGTIANKNVEPGNYVQPGQLLFSIVPEDLYVIANYKETQLERMLPGQKAVVRVDAFPNVRLHGRVDSIQRGSGSRFALLPPENATGNFVKVVQRIPVKIVFNRSDEALPYLSPGMSVETKVYFSKEAR